MKITKKVLITLLAVLTVFPILEIQKIEANALEDSKEYPMACSAYEVDTVNNAGGFSKVSCHNNFKDAMQAMKKLNNDGVVRHAKSYSQTKIVAMNNGQAYSYPFRDGQSLMYYYAAQSLSSNYATTYTGAHYQMHYFETVSYDGSGDGVVHINMNGFDGYVKLKDIDLVPLKYYQNSLSILLGGNETYYSPKEQPFWITPQMNRYDVVQSGKYKDMNFKSWYGYSTNGGALPIDASTPLPAADWMEVGKTYYSYNGYQFYTDLAYTKLAGEYYNYYQFLPLRTKSNISAATYDTFLKNLGYTSSSSKLYGASKAFIDAQNKYGVNALMIFAMACLESGYGTSNYAKNRNNFFGWSAFDSDPGQAATYSSVTSAINEQMALNLAGFLDMDDWRFYGSMLGNKGNGLNVKYASAAYWGIDIASIAYRIDKMSKNNNGQLTDKDAIQLGVITKYNANAYYKIGGGVIYTPSSTNGYQDQYTVSVLNSEGNYFKTQCTNYIENGKVIRILSKSDMREYNWNNSYGYFAKSDIKLINNPKTNVQETITVGDAIETVDSIKLKDKTLTIQGKAYRENLEITSSNPLTDTVYLLDTNGKQIKKYNATTKVSNQYESSWSVAISDLSALNEGIYFLKNAYDYTKQTKYSGAYYLASTSLPSSFRDSGKEITFTNDKNGYVQINVNAIVCEENEIFDESTQACILPIVEEEVLEELVIEDKNLMRGVDDVSYDQNTGTLTIDGVAMFMDDSALQQEKIKHEIVLVNYETLETFIYPTETNTYNQAFKAVDKLYVGYHAEIPLLEIPSGNYFMRVRLTNGSRQSENRLVSTLEDIDVSAMKNTGETVRFFANPVNNYRLEVSVENQSIDLSNTNKPTRRNSAVGFNSVIFDKEHLSIDGYGVIYYASMTKKDNVSFTILLQDENGNLKEYPCTTKDSPLDYGKIFNSNTKINYADYTVDIDLSELEKGNYRLYLDIETNDAHDITEIYDSSTGFNVMGNNNSITYELKKAKTRDRYQLQAY